MKNLLYFLIFLPIISFAQIPNGSFENWTPDNSGVEQPDSWVISGFGQNIVSKSENAVDGNYSMYMENLDLHNNVKAIIDYIPSGPVNKLTGEIQIDSTSLQSGAMITVYGWVNGSLDLLSQDNFWQPTDGFDSFEVPLAIPLNPIDSIRIMIQVGPTPIIDGPAIGLGIVHLDKLALVDSTVVSNSNINLDNRIQFSPNPVRNFLHIESEINDHYDLSIYDLAGKLVLHQKNILQDKDVTLGHLANGLYIVRCETAVGLTYQQKIIKQ